LGCTGTAFAISKTTVRPVRRIVKTELALPRSGPARTLVIAGLVVGGTVAVVMVALFTAFLFETIRSAT
jgi:LPS O-antigen subunit length determinant protein (WzzB/FepE family)